MIGKGYGQREGIPTHETKARCYWTGLCKTEQLDRRPRPPANGQIQALQAASESMVGDRLTPA